MVSRQILCLLVAAALGTAIFAHWVVAPARTNGAGHFANADDKPMVMLGKKIYMGHCAACHGRNLQGQPLWQLNDEYAGRRAPAHDETGHTWQHSDEDIFHVIKFGRFSSVPTDGVSFMPAFDTVLDDREILSVIAFIKGRWPTALRVSQAMLNRGHAGMPPQASDAEWRLPPTCSALVRQRAAIATTNTGAAVALREGLRAVGRTARPGASPTSGQAEAQ